MLEKGLFFFSNNVTALWGKINLKGKYVSKGCANYFFFFFVVFVFVLIFCFIWENCSLLNY